MFLDADERTLLNVYFRPNENEGGSREYIYWPVARMDPDNPTVRPFSGPADLFMSTKGAAMRKLGFSEEEIKAACEKYLHPGGRETGYIGPEVLNG
jgi:hypothetical protein